MYSKNSDKKVLEKAPVKSFLSNDNSKKIDEAIIKREKMVIYILVNYPEESYKAIKDFITVDDMKEVMNKQIIATIYEQYSKGKFNDVLGIFEEQEIVNYLSGIMADDFGITDLNKCIEDLLNIYNKEKLINARNKLMRELESADKSNVSLVSEIETKLNEVIMKIAKLSRGYIK